MEEYRHKKTGNIYLKFDFSGDELINSTNAQDGQEMVLYANKEWDKKVFVREKKEFYEKFELIEDDE